MEQVDRIVAELTRVAERAVVKVSLDCRANLVAAPEQGGTPIDTGWASANWMTSIGGPQAATGENASPSAGDVAAAAAATNGAVAKLLGYRLNQGAVFIANPVPYIGRLNAGHSQQAPAGFVERAIHKALNRDVAIAYGLGSTA